MSSDKTVTQPPAASSQGTTSLPALTAFSPQRLVDTPTVGGRYRLLDKMAEGGMGSIHRAYDEVLKREVALKVIHEKDADKPHIIQRFLEESRITAQLQHPGIPPVHDLGSLPDGRPFLAMKLIKGQTLSDLLPNLTSVGQKLAIFESICQAVAYAHSKNVIHRDLKPLNIMVGAFGETQVMDWGLAKILTGDTHSNRETTEQPQGTILHNPRDSSENSGETVAGYALGTYSHMPPEQALGEVNLVGPASDVFGLGAILCEMLTGQPPYVGTDKRPTSFLAKSANLDDAKARIDRCDVERELKSIALKCLNSEIERRYANAGELTSAVAEYRQESEQRARQAELDALEQRKQAELRELEQTKQAELAASKAKTRRQIFASFALLGILASMLVFIGYTRTQARAYAERLLESPTSEIPKLLPDLNRFWADSILKQAAESDEPKRKLNASLALLSRDESKKTYIAERLLEAAPGDVSVLVGALKPYADIVPKKPSDLRIAALEAANGKVDASSVAGLLVAENSLYFAPWLEAFRPVANDLKPALAAIYRDSKRRESQRTQAVNFLSEYAKDDPTFLADLILDADETAFVTLYHVLTKHSSKAIDALQAELAKKTDDKTPEAERDRLASRQATAAVSLIRLGKAKEVLTLLKFSPDPTVRSWIIHRLKPYGVDVSLIHSQFKTEADISVKRALVLILGEYGLGEPGSIEELKAIYRDHPDAGMHAAAEWTLRRWNQKDWIAEQTKIWAVDKEGREKFTLKRELQSRNWYVTSEGQTMVVVPGPLEFTMGSPHTDSMKFPPEVPHRVRISLTFAIMARHVTLEEFQRFRESHKPPAYIAKVSPTPDCPVHGVTWYEAAAYCNWLSKEEGIPEDQWCYETNAAGVVTKLKPKYLSLTGYRLPSEAEAECTARAGTQSRYSFGEAVALLDYYGWYQRNSNGRSWPYGEKKPNDFGLFDSHGNLYTWCTERFEDYGKGEEVVEDAEDSVQEISNTVSRVMRGGSWYELPSNLRSAYRTANLPTQLFDNVGFRVSRTLFTFE